MAQLLLTSHEKSLIEQIQEEIEQMNKEFEDFIEKSENATNEEEQEKFFRAACGRSKGIRERSKIRESIIRVALERTKPKL